MDIIVTLQTAGLQTLAQVRAFMAGNAPVSFTLTDRTAARRWRAKTLARLACRECGRTDKGLPRGHLTQVTGLATRKPCERMY